MDIFALALGLLLGFLGSLLLLKRDAIQKRMAEKFAASKPLERKTPVAPRRAARLVHDKYVPQHRFREAAEEALRAVLHAATEPVDMWQKFGSHPSVLYLKKTAAGNPVPILRGDGRIDASPLALLEFLMEPSTETIKAIDPMVRTAKLIEELDSQSDVCHTVYSGFGMIAGREFCVLRQCRRVPEGLVFAVVSIEHDSFVPTRGLVRGKTDFYGFVLRPVGESSCDATIVAQADLGGSLPRWATNQVANDQPKKVSLLRALAALNCARGDDDGDEQAAALREMLLARGREAAEQLEKDVQQGGWLPVREKCGVQLFRKQDTLHKFKGEGVINVGPAELGKLLGTVGMLRQYDTLCREATEIDKLDDDTRVIYSLYQARRCLLTAARDFCLVVHGKTLADGTFVLAGASVEHPKCPVGAGTVRAFAHCSGFILRPLDGGRQSHVTYMAQVDLRGGIPDKLVEFVAKRLPLCIHNLREWLKTHHQTIPRPAG